MGQRDRLYSSSTAETFQTSQWYPLTNPSPSHCSVAFRAAQAWWVRKQSGSAKSWQARSWHSPVKALLKHGLTNATQRPWKFCHLRCYWVVELNRFLVCWTCDETGEGCRSATSLYKTLLGTDKPTRVPKHNSLIAVFYRYYRVIGRRHNIFLTLLA